MSKYKFTLKQARQLKGLRLQDAADKMGVHLHTIRNWELGITKIGAQNLIKLCQVYGIDQSNIVLGD